MSAGLALRLLGGHLIVAGPLSLGLAVFSLIDAAPPACWAPCSPIEDSARPPWALPVG
ncbi:hypothetical protein [Actinoallomurus acaciae]|uniref:Uncharacterized protein n=1 Tax=Actinoallomurus acaciae TaxID=502577 RepID=A0ABV5YUK7_9ACTN